ncbi:MAG: ORF6N domain-containing protein [Ruminococcus sp.]|nr:ORF6N domain-containing protein [Ruminococcus sp.]
MTSTNIQVIEMQGVRVLTTAQLAESYGTDSKVISYNFNHNKDRYEEGKHYICLTGDELRAFREIHDLPKNLNKTYLWTERGALLHAKSLNTDTAWEVYDQLVETYFRAKKAQAALNDLSPQLQFMIRMETEQNALKAKVADIEQRLDSMTAVPEPDPEPPKAFPKKWSERETDYLRKAYALGQTDTEIAADLGRTEDSVRTKRWRIGLESDNKKCRHWTMTEDRKLIRLAKLGVSCSDIAKTIGRSPEGVQQGKNRLKKAGRL